MVEYSAPADARLSIVNSMANNTHFWVLSIQIRDMVELLNVDMRFEHKEDVLLFRVSAITITVLAVVAAPATCAA